MWRRVHRGVAVGLTTGVGEDIIICPYSSGAFSGSIRSIPRPLLGFTFPAAKYAIGSNCDNNAKSIEDV